MKSKITLPIEELPIPKLTRSTNEQMPAAVIAEKKKRGRPRLVQIEEPPPPPVVITEKKKRGRPKKIIV